MLGCRLRGIKKELDNSIGYPPFLIVSKWHDPYFSSIEYVIMAR